MGYKSRSVGGFVVEKTICKKCKMFEKFCKCKKKKERITMPRWMSIVFFVMAVLALLALLFVNNEYDRRNQRTVPYSERFIG